MVRIVPIFLILLAGIFACSNSDNSTEPTLDMDKKPIIVAHRGASGYAPENTVSAVKKAIDLKAPYIEIDVHLSKDGEVIVIHDKTLERTTTGKGEVVGHTLAELKQLDAGSWYGEEFKGEPVPTLGDVLEAIDGQAVLLIEVKNGNQHYEDIEQKVWDIIQQYDALAWCEVQSFHSEVVKNFIALETPLKVHKLIAKRLPAIGMYIDDGLKFGSGTNWENKVVGINPNFKDASKKFVSKLHDDGYTCFVWTVNEKEDMQKMIENGVDGIITNYPDLLDKQ